MWFNLLCPLKQKRIATFVVHMTILQISEHKFFVPCKFSLCKEMLFVYWHRVSWLVTILVTLWITFVFPISHSNVMPRTEYKYYQIRYCRKLAFLRFVIMVDYDHLLQIHYFKSGLGLSFLDRFQHWVWFRKGLNSTYEWNNIFVLKRLTFFKV